VTRGCSGCGLEQLPVEVPGHDLRGVYRGDCERCGHPVVPILAFSLRLAIQKAWLRLRQDQGSRTIQEGGSEDLYPDPSNGHMTHTD